MRGWGHIAEGMNVYTREGLFEEKKGLTIVVETGQRGTGLCKEPATNLTKLPSLQKYQAQNTFLSLDSVSRRRTNRFETSVHRKSLDQVESDTHDYLVSAVKLQASSFKLQALYRG